MLLLQLLPLLRRRQLHLETWRLDGGPQQDKHSTGSSSN
jgi:hypothetical protein